MVDSNLTNVFTQNHEQSRQLTEEELKDCLPCQVMATFTAFTASYYFGSGLLFKNDNDFVKNPKWWRTQVKFFGYGLGLFAIYRGGQGWLWQTDKQYKPVKF